MRRTLSLLLFLTIILGPQSAAAFCGFYVAGGDASLFNDATQVALVRDGTRTVLSMQNSYEGPAEAFAMVVPVPQVLDEANVKTLEKEVFDRLDEMTAPRLVEYWEKNPCRSQVFSPMMMMAKSKRVYESAQASPSSYGVEIESKFKVGEYDVVVLSAKESTGLDAYLRAEEYNIPDGAEPYLRPYVEEGSYFFVAKVDPARATFEDDRAILSPLRFEYDSEEFRLPIRLGMINSAGEQDLIVYTIGPNQRYEVANYPNAFIPTNLEVDGDVKESFGTFYQSLFAATVEKNPGAVITEYSWQFSGCDPCPTHPLGSTEKVALGMERESEANDPGTRGAGAWTVTRLHARYAPDDIGEDLVFREAPPVIGGRERTRRHRGDASGRPQIEQTQVGTSVGLNQFQGRYIIRHRYIGPITCVNPDFGRWGGPPGGKIGEAMFTAMSPNTDGAEPIVETGELGQWLEQGVEELGIEGRTPTPLSPDWFTFVFGYTLTLILLAVALFSMRLVRKKSFVSFIGLVVIVFLAVTCGLPVGQIGALGLLIGSFAIFVEGLVVWRRTRHEPAPDDELPSS